MAVRFFRSRGTPPRDDSLQISGAIVAPSDGPSPVQLVDAGRAPHGLGVVRDQYERKIRKSPTIRMVPSSMMVEGRRLRFAVSDNVDAHGPDGPGSPPVWAVNIHGYFAGGGMYWRESARLAEQLGWRVINPSLPGFGGSDPLDWQDVSMESLANQVMAIVHKVDAGPVVLLGHSMGGAVAVQFAHDHPRRTLGVIYRDGVSTPAWKERRGILPTLLSPLLPDVAPMVDLVAAVVLDLPDLFIGRMYSTVRAVLPDMRQNIRTMSQTLPVGQHAHGRRPAQRGAPPRGPADPHPQRVGLLRPHHARAPPRSSSPPSPALRCCGCRAATAGCWPDPRGRPTSSRISSRAEISWRG